MPLQLGDLCPVCLQYGRTGTLAQQQVNFEEALLLCDNDVCVFPMGYHDVHEYSIVSHIEDLPVVAETCQTQSVNDSLSFIQEVLGQVEEKTTKPVQNEVEVANKKSVFLQWRNNNALCWLDVLLNLLVHCTWLRRLVDTREPTIPSTITMLMATYDHALFMMTKQKSGKELKNVVAPSGGGSCGEPLQQPTGGNPILRRFFDSLDVYGLSGKEKPTTEVVKTPTHSVLNYDSHELPDLSKTIASKPVKIEDKPEALVKLRRHLRQAASQYKNLDVRVYHESEKLLNCAREEVWEKLHPLMQCEKGKNDSPLIALFVLLHTWTTESAHVGKLFNICGRWEMTCTACKISSNMTISAKSIVTFPLVKQDFSVNNAYFIRACPSCSAPNQEYRLHIDEMPECLMFHFMNGLPSCDLDKYSFVRNGDNYRVRALVRYRNKPTDHFIAYVRDMDNRMWMECDDLKSPLCTYSTRKLQIPPNEIHLMMWEKDHRLEPVVVSATSSVSSAKPVPVPSGSIPSVPSSVASHHSQEVILDDAELNAILAPIVPAMPEQATESKVSLGGPKSCSSQENANSHVSSNEHVPSPHTSSEENRPTSRSSSRECKPLSRAASQERLGRSRASSQEGKSHSRASSQEAKPRSRNSSQRASRAPTPSMDGGVSEHSSGDRATSVAASKPATEKSVVEKLKDLRHSVFKEKTVDYVWDRLTSDNKSVSGKDAAIKAYAECQKQQEKRSGATPKLRSRLSSYLSSLKPQKSACQDFQSYTPEKVNVSTAIPPAKVPKLMDNPVLAVSDNPGPAGDASSTPNEPTSSKLQPLSRLALQPRILAPVLPIMDSPVMAVSNNNACPADKECSASTSTPSKLQPLAPTDVPPAQAQIPAPILPILPTAPLELETPYTIGGRALSVDDSASIISTSSFSSLPSVAQSERTISSRTSMQTQCSNTSSTKPTSSKRSNTPSNNSASGKRSSTPSTKSSSTERSNTPSVQSSSSSSKRRPSSASWIRRLPEERKRKYIELFSTEGVPEVVEALLSTVEEKRPKKKHRKTKYKESESEKGLDDTMHGVFDTMIGNESETEMDESDIAAKNLSIHAFSADTKKSTPKKSVESLLQQAIADLDGADSVSQYGADSTSGNVEDSDINGLMSILDCSIDTVGSDFLSTDFDDILEGPLAGSAEIVPMATTSAIKQPKMSAPKRPRRPPSRGKNIEQMAKDKIKQPRGGKGKFVFEDGLDTLSGKPTPPKRAPRKQTPKPKNPDDKPRSTKGTGLQEGDEIVMNEKGEYMVLRKIDPKLIQKLNLPPAKTMPNLDKTIEEVVKNSTVLDLPTEHHVPEKVNVEGPETAAQKFLEELAENLEVEIEYPQNEAASEVICEATHSVEQIDQLISAPNTSDTAESSISFLNEPNTSGELPKKQLTPQAKKLKKVPVAKLKATPNQARAINAKLNLAKKQMPSKLGVKAFAVAEKRPKLSPNTAHLASVMQRIVESSHKHAAEKTGLSKEDRIAMFLHDHDMETDNA